jgi:uncharacterized protein (TIGR02598 family)
MSIHILAKRKSVCGFSLVEVVIALGVIAFSLVAILGVFPAGLASNRASINDTRASQLARAIIATIDAQCATFSNVNCYGATLNLATFGTDHTETIFAGYPSPNQPEITSTANANSVYTIELRFNNDPALTSTTPPIQLGTGKSNQMEIRIYGKSHAEGFVEFFYLARNKG